MKSRPLFLFCIFFGIAVHGVAIYWLSKQNLCSHHLCLKESPWLHHPPIKEPFCQKRNKQLSEIFQNLQKAPPKQTPKGMRPTGEFAPPWPIALVTYTEPHSNELQSLKMPLFAPDESLLPLKEMTSTTIPGALEQGQQKEISTLSKTLFKKEGKLPKKSTDKQNKGARVAQFSKESHSLPYDPSSPNYTTQKEGEASKLVGAMANSNYFDCKVECAPKRARPGYVFKITLTPKDIDAFKRISQNYTFLLDRSNSIPRSRYYAGKKAIFDALSYLKPLDTFNILIFDDRVSRLSNKPLTFSPEAIHKAKQFLERHSHGGLFASTDIYASLGKIVPNAVSSQEVHTAILLSDGDTYLSQEQQRETIGKWTMENRGKVSLFCAASGVGNNLPLLDFMARFNKGKLIYTKEHKSMPLRVCHLMRSIQNPIGKALVVKAVTTDRKQIVMLQPKNSRLPLLYKKRPFVILGSTNRLRPFSLFIQGQACNLSFDITKKIDLKQGAPATLSLETEWVTLVAQECFERYFEEGKASYLQQAKELLEPLNLPVPFVTP